MLTIQVSGGLQEAIDKVSNFGVTLDLEGALDEATTIFLQRIRTRFLARTDPDGKPWISSAAGLLRQSGGKTYRNGKSYSGTGTLFETGTLFHSIQAAKEKPTGQRAIETDVPYAPFLQVSTAKHPAWVFLGFSDNDLDTFEKLILVRIKEKFS